MLPGWSATNAAPLCSAFAQGEEMNRAAAGDAQAKEGLLEAKNRAAAARTERNRLQAALERSRQELENVKNSCEFCEVLNLFIPRGAISSRVILQAVRQPSFCALEEDQNAFEEKQSAYEGGQSAFEEERSAFEEVPSALEEEQNVFRKGTKRF
eukprot:1161346-Pelagomonas_calceolata.AAC.9